VEITFLLPESAELSPIGTNVTLAEVALVTDVPGESPQRFSVPISDGSNGLNLGRLPVADGVRLSVELRAPSQRLIGYGRSPSPVDVVADGVIQIEIRLRRPFAYVTGGAEIATYDAALEPGFPYRGAISVAPVPLAAVSTFAGDELVTVSANELRLVSTSSHTPMEFSPVPLAQAPNSVALSPDDQFAIIGHGGATGGISIVRLADVRGETAAANFIPMGNVTGVDASMGVPDEDPPLAFALIDGIAPDVECATAGTSSIVGVSVANPSEIVLTVAPGLGVSDFAVHPVSDAMALAAPCASSWNVKAVRHHADPTDIIDLQELGRATRIAIVNDRVWSVGVQPSSGTTGARLIVGAVGFDRTGVTVLELPEAEERALSRDFTGPGQFAELAMNADALFPLDLAVLPGEGHVAVLTRGFYHGNEVVGTILGIPTLIVPEMTITAFEYQLIDAGSGTPVQRVRTMCDLDWSHDAYLDDFACTTVPGQDIVPNPEFAPRHLSVLNGAR